MENKTLVVMFAIILIGTLLFLGASITGFVLHKVEYNDLCRSDEHCFKGECCFIYEGKDVGICMEQCQSLEFLCQKNEECEEGTVCCITEKAEYGICNQANKCLDVDIFAEYIGKVSFVDISMVEKAPQLEKPMQIDSNKVVIVQTGIIIALIGFIIWLLTKKKR